MTHDSTNAVYIMQQQPRAITSLKLLLEVACAFLCISLLRHGTAARRSRVGLSSYAGRQGTLPSGSPCPLGCPPGDQRLEAWGPVAVGEGRAREAASQGLRCGGPGAKGRGPGARNPEGRGPRAKGKGPEAGCRGPGARNPGGQNCSPPRFFA